MHTNNDKENKANVQATELAQFYRSAGMTYAQIADRLNQIHYLTRRSKSFEGKDVYRLLKRKEENNGKVLNTANG